jgi:hypothetical protein
MPIGVLRDERHDVASASGGPRANRSAARSTSLRAARRTSSTICWLSGHPTLRAAALVQRSRPPGRRSGGPLRTPRAARTTAARPGSGRAGIGPVEAVPVPQVASGSPGRDTSPPWCVDAAHAIDASPNGVGSGRSTRSSSSGIGNPSLRPDLVVGVVVAGSPRRAQRPCRGARRTRRGSRAWSPGHHRCVRAPAGTRRSARSCRRALLDAGEAGLRGVALALTDQLERSFSALARSSIACACPSASSTAACLRPCADSTAACCSPSARAIAASW